MEGSPAGGGGSGGGSGAINAVAAVAAAAASAASAAASTPAPYPYPSPEFVSRRKKRAGNWSPEETLVLIQLWRTHLYDLRSAKRNSHVYHSMADKMAKMGFVRLPAEVRNKILNLTADYRKEKLKMEATGSPSSWKYWSEVKEVMESLSIQEHPGLALKDLRMSAEFGDGGGTSPAASMGSEGSSSGGGGASGMMPGGMPLGLGAPDLPHHHPYHPLHSMHSSHHFSHPLHHHPMQQHQNPGDMMVASLKEGSPSPAEEDEDETVGGADGEAAHRSSPSPSVEVTGHSVLSYRGEYLQLIRALIEENRRSSQASEEAERQTLELMRQQLYLKQQSLVLQNRIVTILERMDVAEDVSSSPSSSSFRQGSRKRPRSEMEPTRAQQISYHSDAISNAKRDSMEEQNVQEDGYVECTENGGVYGDEPSSNTSSSPESGPHTADGNN